MNSSENYKASENVENVTGSGNKADGIGSEERISESERLIKEDIKMGNRYDFPEKLKVTVAPHIKGGDDTRHIMLDVLIALMPAYIWGVLVFGLKALWVGLVSVASAVLFEYLFQRIMHRRNTIGDLSAAVTGLLLAMNLSSEVPLWIPVVGSFFAIVVVKGLFGGLGKNIVNPALAARIFMFIAWPTQMNEFVPVVSVVGGESSDAVASATVLTSIKAGNLPDKSFFELILGSKGGCIGEISALFLLIGGIYLLLRRVISWQAPAAYIGTVALIALAFPRAGAGNLESVMFEVFSGGVIICALFMATDYVTTPVTGWGRLIFGLGCGLITMLIRYKGGYSEGASFSVLIMNLLVWYIDKLTMPKPFGTQKVKGGKSNG